MSKRFPLSTNIKSPQSLSVQQRKDMRHGHTVSQTLADEVPDARGESRIPPISTPPPQQLCANISQGHFTPQPARSFRRSPQIPESSMVAGQERTDPSPIPPAFGRPRSYNFSSVISFEGLFEMTLEELNEISIIDRPETVSPQRPQIEMTEERMLKLVEIAEPFAKFFACCEVTVVSNMKDRFISLPEDPRSCDLVLRLTRVASFLRRNIFRKGRLLGTGSYGRVFLTRTRHSPKEYALKQVQINIPENAEKKSIDHFMLKQIHTLREKDAMLMADHPFICKLKASWVEKQSRKKLSYMFLMEYAPFGTLRQFIKDKFHKTMPRCLHDFDNGTILQIIQSHHANPLKLSSPIGLTERRKLIYIYAAEMTSALEFLHDSGVVHRDFKPGNVLIGVDYHLRVADFGFTNPHKAYHSFQFHNLNSPLAIHPALRNDPMEDIDDKDLRAGTIAYCYTPEVLRKQVTDTNRHFLMDMWSLGVSLFELYTGVQPFNGMIQENLRDPRLLVREIFLWRRNRLLTNPLYEAIVDDGSYRDLLSTLICDMGTRLTSSQALAVLDEKVKELTGRRIMELCRSRLDFLIEVFGPVRRETSPEFANAWSDEGGSIHSAEGMPAVMKTFPYLGSSPRI